LTNTLPVFHWQVLNGVPMQQTTHKAQILDGKSISNHVRNELASEIKALNAKIKLCVILVGEDPASAIYVEQKHKACATVGIESESIKLPASISHNELLTHIDNLNNRDDITGILVQLPLPAHINTNEVLQRVHPNKDVDCFHPQNIGLLAQRMPGLRPCTPWGMIKMLEHNNLEVRGKHAVVVGASNIVGRPMALELLIAGATVTVCHRFTEDLAYHVKQADILVAAAGKPGLIKGKWVKEGAVVLDVGIHRTENGLCGDVEFEVAAQRASWISPVPGGVGPMTVTSLMENTVRAYKMQQEAK